MSKVQSFDKAAFNYILERSRAADVVGRIERETVASLPGAVSKFGELQAALSAAIVRQNEAGTQFLNELRVLPEQKQAYAPKVKYDGGNFPDVAAKYTQARTSVDGLIKRVIETMESGDLWSMFKMTNDLMGGLSVEAFYQDRYISGLKIFKAEKEKR